MQLSIAVKENKMNGAGGHEKIKKKNVFHQGDMIEECRACSEKFKNYGMGLLNMFQPWNTPWNGMADTIAEDLARLTDIEVSMVDEYSKLICLTCYYKLFEACNFIMTVRLNDRMNRDKAYEVGQKEPIWPQPIQVDRDVNNEVLINSMLVDIKEEILSEEEVDDVTEDAVGKGTEFINVEIKQEPEENQEPRENVDTPSIKITVNGTITNDQFEHNSLQTNGISESEYQCRNIKEVQVKEELQSDEEDPEPVRDLSLECILCTKTFTSVSGLKAHVLSQHSYGTVKRKPDGGSAVKKKANHVCATCRCSFATPTDLMVHETRHNAFACYVCNAKFDTFELLTKHRKKCKSAKSNNLPKLKTLEDVIRPQVPSPQLSETSMKESSAINTWTSSSVEVLLKMNTVSDEQNNATSEIKLEQVDTS